MSFSETTLTDCASLLIPEPFASRLPLCDIMGQRLGYGRCGYVHECVIGGVLSALKLVDPNNERDGKQLTEAIFRESEAYGKLSELQSGAIPLLVLAATDYLGMLLLATELCSEGVCQTFGEGEKRLALDSLRLIHSMGYIHGDIRKENVVFHVKDGVRKAFWIDLETCQLGLAGQFESEVRLVLHL